MIDHITEYGSGSGPVPLKWRPVEFKACGRTEHIGRARWNAKLGAWEVREMRPGYPAAPSLYGPSAVYSIRWIARERRDVIVEEARKVAEVDAENERRANVNRAVRRAVDSGCSDQRTIVDAARGETHEAHGFVLGIFRDMKDRGEVVRQGRRYIVNDDIPF